MEAIEASPFSQEVMRPHRIFGQAKRLHCQLRDPVAQAVPPTAAAGPEDAPLSRGQGVGAASYGRANVPESQGLQSLFSTCPAPGDMTHVMRSLL